MIFKTGSLVTSVIMGDSIGIVVSQLDNQDRWVILWPDGYEAIFWGCSLDTVL